MPNIAKVLMEELSKITTDAPPPSMSWFYATEHEMVDAHFDSYGFRTEVYFTPRGIVEKGKNGLVLRGPNSIEEKDNLIAWQRMVLTRPRILITEDSTHSTHRATMEKLIHSQQKAVMFGIERQTNTNGKVKCEYCKTKYDREASYCPKCGGPNAD